MKTLYAILNQDAKAWWYYKQLRQRGQHEEARRKERESIRSKVKTLRQALAARGGHASIGRGGWSVSYGDGCSLQGHGTKIERSATMQAALLVGLPVIDTTTIDDNTIYSTISLPLVAVCREPDKPAKGPKPYGGFSYAPLAWVAARYQDMGATLYNFEVTK